MEITLLDDMYYTLYTANDALYERFLKKHMNGTGSVEEFKLDTRSYCVLLHAALENFVEDVSLFVANYSFFLFKECGEVTIPLMFLLNGTKSYDDRFVTKGDTDDSDDDSYHIKQHVVEFIVDCEMKTIMKWKNVITSNHGIKTKHLNSVLQSVGIHCDVEDANFSSWKNFSSYRGSFAHLSEPYLSDDSSSSAIKELSPEYAFKYGNECVDYSITIIEEAKRILSGKQYVKRIVDDLIKARTDKAKKLADENVKKKAEKEREDLENEEKKKLKEIKDKEKRERNIYLTNQLDVLLNHINSNPDKYGELHLALFPQRLD